MKISVIVPCYNTELWISRCLDSILNQSYSDLEIIVIDDGSTDGSWKIIDSYAARDSRIIAVHQENHGLVAVRERGISIASGDYVGFVDGDDTIEPDMYERLMENALKYDADISHCGMAFVFQDGHTELHHGTNRLIVQNNFEGQRDLLQGSEIEPSLCCKIFRRSILPDSCLDLTIQNNEDLLRNFVLFQRSRLSVYQDFCGYKYYQYPTSMSKNAAKKLQITKCFIKARFLITKNCDSNIEPFALQLWLSSLIYAVNNFFDDTSKDAQDYCTLCINTLKSEKSNIKYLIRRQQILAYLILYFPFIYKIIYKIYDYGR